VKILIAVAITAFVVTFWWLMNLYRRAPVPIPWVEDDDGIQPHDPHAIDLLMDDIIRRYGAALDRLA
jgi:hypothetical protein